MLGRFSWMLLICFTHAAVAADASGDLSDFPADQTASIAPTTIQNYSLDTPIEILAANPAAAAILNANIPGLLEDDSYFLFKDMSLENVASLSHGQITSDTLQTIATQLKSVPISTSAK